MCRFGDEEASYGNTKVLPQQLYLVSKGGKFLLLHGCRLPASLGDDEAAVRFPKSHVECPRGSTDVKRDVNTIVCEWSEFRIPVYKNVAAANLVIAVRAMSLSASHAASPIGARGILR